MKLSTLIDGHQRKCRVQEPYSITSSYRVISFSNFCNNLCQHNFAPGQLMQWPVVRRLYVRRLLFTFSTSPPEP